MIFLFWITMFTMSFLIIICSFVGAAFIIGSLFGLPLWVAGIAGGCIFILLSIVMVITSNYY